MNTFLISLDEKKQKPFILPKAIQHRIATKSEIVSTYSSPEGEQVWVATGAVRWVNALIPCRKSHARSLLLWDRPRDPHTIDLVRDYFQHVWVRPDTVMLTKNEIQVVFSAEHPDHLFLGGHANKETETLTLIRGNLMPLHLPYSSFGMDGTSPKPAFDKFRVTDYGQTIQLGAYETSASALLYRFDKEYRTFVKVEKLRIDKSFGASLKRLRLLSGLSQSNFEPEIDRRQIIRLENNEISKPRKSTLAHLAKKMQVRPEDIVSY